MSVDIKVLYEQQGGCCLYCGAELNGQYHLDHKTPLIRGGTNWPNNLACSCATCNLRKNNKTAEEYLETVAR